MLSKKLLLKKYIFSIFTVIFISSYSQAGLFIARNFDRFKNGATQAASSFVRSFDPRYLQRGWSELPFADGVPDVNEQAQEQLNVLPDAFHSAAQAVGDVARLGPILREVDTISSNTTNAFRDIQQEATNRIDQMQTNLTRQVNEMRENTIHELNTTARDVVNNVNDQLYITANTMNDRFFRKLNRLTEKGALLAGSVALTSIAGWYGTKFLYNVLDKRYKKPKLFQETSRKTLLQKLKELVYKTQNEPQVLIFDSKKEAELANLTQSVKNTNAKLMAGDPTVRHRSVLFWGPPGTGKTAFASKLARESGMDFETMSGADISKLNTQDALVALDEVFDYAQKSKKGLILMVDEAESLFAKREGTKPDSASYLVLSKFLSLTSGRIKKLMLVITTNHKEILDEALVSRLDRSIEILLPDYSERLKILNLYKDKYLTDGRYNSAEFISSVTEHLNDYKMDQLANQLTGFSGRDLESVMHNIKSESEHVLTAEVVNKVVQDALNKFIQFHPGSYDTKNVQGHSLVNAAARFSLGCQA